MLTWTLEWTKEIAFNSFLASEDFTAFIDPVKPLAVGPAELQLFDTDVGPLDVVSTPLTEIISIQLNSNADLTTMNKEAWIELVVAMGSDVPVTSGTSLN